MIWVILRININTSKMSKLKNLPIDAIFLSTINKLLWLLEEQADSHLNDLYLARYQLY